MNSFFSHLKGLMFSKRLRKNEGMLFVFPSSRQVDIHMLFVFFPIDAIWIDEKGFIVHVARDVRPFTPFVKGGFSSYLLEVGAGTAQHVRVGDRVTINLKRSSVS